MERTEEKPKAISKSRQESDDKENAKIVSSSAPLAMLLMPALKEVTVLQFALSTYLYYKKLNKNIVFDVFSICFN